MAGPHGPPPRHLHRSHTIEPQPSPLASRPAPSTLRVRCIGQVNHVPAACLERRGPGPWHPGPAALAGVVEAERVGSVKPLRNKLTLGATGAPQRLKPGLRFADAQAVPVGDGDWVWCVVLGRCGSVAGERRSGKIFKTDKEKPKVQDARRTLARPQRPRTPRSR